MGLGVGIICKQNLQGLKDGDGDGDGLKHHTTISSQFKIATLPDEILDAHSVINDLRLEYVIAVEGVVWSRPSESVNKKRKTGMIEVVAEHVQVLNAVRSKLPFLVTISDMELMKNKFVMLPREDALLDGSPVA